MAYCTAQNIYDRYGQDNVRKWADLGSRDGTVIDARIASAIATGDGVIDAHLLGGDYTIPLAAADPIIIRTAVQLAGADLYHSRGADDFDDETGKSRDRMSGEEAEAMETLRKIRAGQIRLSSAGTPTDSTPEVIDIETSRDATGILDDTANWV